MTSNGRKLPRHYDDPIDSILVDFVEILNPYFKSMNFTPNGITTLSAIFGLAAVYVYTKHKYVTCAVLWTIGYFFDCMDGNYARTYSMSSKYGDIYDHVSDAIVNVSLLVAVIMNRNITTLFKLLGISSLLLFFVIMTFYFACQEQYLGKHRAHLTSDTIGMVPTKCTSVKNLSWLRFFGSGMFNLCVVILLLCHTVRL